MTAAAAADTGSATEGWVLWFPSCPSPSEHPAMSCPAASLYRLEPLEGLESAPSRVMVVCEKLLDAQSARAMWAEGSAEIAAWSWLLPEHLAAEMTADGIPVVYGFHSIDDLRAALRGGQPSASRPAEMAEIEQLAGLGAELG